MSRPSVDPQVLRECTRVSRWKSLALCLGIYAAVIGLAWLGGRGSNGWLAVPCILVIGALQNHLLILLHEGSHLLLHPDRRVNDLIADVFCAVPVLTLVKNYRAFHLNHHKYASSPERDPEVRFYTDQKYAYARKKGWPLVRMLLADLSGIHFVAFNHSMNRYLAEMRQAGKLEAPNLKDGLLYLILWGGVGLLSWRFGFWKELLLFWILPMPLVLFPLLKLHGYGEHTGATGPTEFERTWVHAFNPVTDFFIYPIFSGYHLEHHFFPRVPWYHMGRFRRTLLANPEYAERAANVTVTSYFLGERSIWRTMIAGTGEYRVQTLAAQTEEIRGDVVTPDTKAEVDAQLETLIPRASKESHV